MYGLILHELLTKNKSTINHTSVEYLQTVLIQEYQANEDLTTYIDIIKETVDHNPVNRPSFDEIIIRLESLMDNLSNISISNSQESQGEQNNQIEKDFVIPVFETPSYYKED